MNIEESVREVILPRSLDNAEWFVQAVSKVILAAPGYYRLDHYDGEHPTRTFVRGGPDDEFATLDLAQRALAERVTDAVEYRIVKVLEEVVL